MVKIRNQASAVISKRVGGSHLPERNGEFWFLDRVAPLCSVFVDVGANVGTWSKRVLQSAGSRAVQIHAFEPGDAAFQALEVSLGSLENIWLNKLALGREPGKPMFAELPFNTELSSFVMTKRHQGATLVPAEVSTLDIYAARRRIELLDFLKIDTEGWDLRVLLGASGLLEEGRIRYIQFEYNECWAEAGSTLAAALSLLRSHGFKVFLLRSGGLFRFDYEVFGDFFSYSNFIAVKDADLAVIEQIVRGYL